MKKLKYEKPKMTIKKLSQFFFACVTSAKGCRTAVSNRIVGSGCKV